MNTNKTAKLQPMPPLTASQKGEILTKIRAEKQHLTIRDLASLTGISPSYVAKLLKREQESSPVHSTDA